MLENEEVGLVDTPVISLKDDSLGLGPYVRSLSNLIRTCATPMTISIQGDWGSGKTSFMKMVKEDLEKPNQKIRIVEFNTWQYSKFNLDDLLAISFLESFATEIIGEKITETKALNEVFKTLKSIVPFISPIIGGLTQGAINSSFFENILPEAPTLNVVEQVSELRKQLEGIVDNLIQKNKVDRVVVFIDDIDRLHPSKAVDLLEVLQLFLTIKNCVFVLSVDYDVVIQGIQSKYGTQYSNMKAKNFFDKIIQLPFSIPVGSSEEIEGYVEKLLSSIPDVEVTNIKEYVSIINKSVQFNPRNIKRVINAYWLLLLVISEKENVAQMAETNELNLALFTVLCMQLSYAPLYTKIIKTLDDRDELKELFENKSDIAKYLEDYESEFSNEAINWERCQEFLNDFERIFKIGEGKNFELLEYVMLLSQSTSQDSDLQDDKMIAAVVIRSREKIDGKKLNKILKGEYSTIIEQIKIVGDGFVAVVKFFGMVSKSYRLEIKKTLLETEFPHYIVTSHKHNYLKI